MKYKFEILENKEVWNSFLENYPTTSSGIPTVTFIQSYNWLEFQTSLGKKTLSLGVYDGETLIGIVAGVHIEAKRGKYLYIRNGPVIDWSNKTLIDELIGYLKDYAKKNGLWFVRISPLVERGSKAEVNMNSIGAVDCPVHDVEALDTWIWDIQKSEDELLGEIKKKTRYLVRKGIKDTEVIVSSSVEDVDIFFEILKDTVQRQGWNSYSREYILEEFKSFVEDGLANLILVKFENKYIAGGIFIHFGGQSAYHYGATLSAYNHIPGAYVMIWEAVKLAKSKGSKFFNFWGVSPVDKPNHPWNGLSMFKRKFPGFEQTWAHSKDLPVSKLYWLTNLYERYDKMRKGY